MPNSCACTLCFAQQHELPSMHNCATVNHYIAITCSLVKEANKDQQKQLLTYLFYEQQWADTLIWVFVSGDGSLFLSKHADSNSNNEEHDSQKWQQKPCAHACVELCALLFMCTLIFLFLLQRAVTSTLIFSWNESLAITFRQTNCISSPL